MEKKKKTLSGITSKRQTRMLFTNLCPMIICQPNVVIIALRESFLQKDELFGHDNQQLSANCSAFALCPHFTEEPDLSGLD